MHHFLDKWCYFLNLFLWLCCLQVRIPQGTIISDNCVTDKNNFDGVVLPSGKENEVNKA